MSKAKETEAAVFIVDDDPPMRESLSKKGSTAQPVKWMKLIQWWLDHRVPIDMIITPADEAAACMLFKIPELKWEEAKKRVPSQLPKVNQKRLRRMEYALETEKIPRSVVLPGQIPSVDALQAQVAESWRESPSTA